MSEEVQKMFSSIAPSYDRLNRVLSLQIDRFWRKEAIAELTHCNKVLDLCAGTLDLSIMLAQQAPRIQIDAVDFSAEMLSHGATKLDDDLNSRIRTFCADAQKLPFKDDSYDGAMVAYGMRNVDDNQRALTEILRVIKPGGLLVILEFFKPNRLGARLFHATYGRFIIPCLGGLISGNRQAYRYLRDSIRSFHTAEEYESLMSRCGFHDVHFKHQWSGASTLFIGKKS